MTVLYPEIVIYFSVVIPDVVAISREKIDNSYTAICLQGFGHSRKIIIIMIMP